MPQKFSGRAHAENKLSVQAIFDSPPPPQNQIVVPLQDSCKIAFQSITDKLSVAHCASRHLQLALAYRNFQLSEI